MTKMKFSEIININDLKTMAENLYSISGIPLAIVDVEGKIHVAVGGQDICTKYHRVNTVSCERCRKSDKYINDRLNAGTYITYKCQNNMWDVAMPIFIYGEHVASVFIGQFFYEGELIDEEYFRKQAQEFGFDEEQYIAALHKVPVFSEERVDNIMKYYSGLVKTLVESG